MAEVLGKIREQNLLCTCTLRENTVIGKNTAEDFYFVLLEEIR